MTVSGMPALAQASMARSTRLYGRSRDTTSALGGPEYASIDPANREASKGGYSTSASMP